MLKKIYQKLFYNPYKFVKNNNEMIKVGDSILTKSFAVNFTDNSNLHVIVGDGCVLANSITFEKNSGIVSIGNNTYIGGGTHLISINSISIGSNVQISWGVTIYDHNGNSLNYLDRRIDSKNIYKNYHTRNMLKEFNWNNVKSAPIIIEDDVWIGFGATILKGVKIGKGAIVGAQSVVTKDVEPFTVVMGNPAQKIKDLKNEI